MKVSEDGSSVHEDLLIERLSEEHGVVRVLSGATDLKPGDCVRVIPNHSCLTAACHDEYAVVEGDRVADRWKIWRGR